MLIKNHFPIVRFQEDGKFWFNPAQKVRAADRPEERVRLRMVEFLVREAGFSLNRITTELPVKHSRDEHSLRADILCFDALLRPLLLVECKAESVRLDEKTALQSAVYNRSIQAPHILLTNGFRDILFTIRESGTPEIASNFGDVFQLIKEPERDMQYWQDRALWGNCNPEEEAELSKKLSRFWDVTGTSDQIQYIKSTVPEEVSGNTLHLRSVACFARIQSQPDGSRVASAVFSDAARHTHGLRITLTPGKQSHWEMLPPVSILDSF